MIVIPKVTPTCPVRIVPASEAEFKSASVDRRDLFPQIHRGETPLADIKHRVFHYVVPGWMAGKRDFSPSGGSYNGDTSARWVSRQVVVLTRGDSTSGVSARTHPQASDGHGAVCGHSKREEGR